MQTEKRKRKKKKKKTAVLVFDPPDELSARNLGNLKV